jgi:outer membrane protein assembly factor BamB
VEHPVIIRVDGNDQLLCSMPKRVIACDPETGSVLWTCTGLAHEKVDLVYASPVVSGGIGVAFTGWINGPTIGFKLGGSGDVTPSNRLWLEKQPQRIGSGVVVNGRLYIVNAGPGTAQCIECQTGKILWTERLEGGWVPSPRRAALCHEPDRCHHGVSPDRKVRLWR